MSSSSNLFRRLGPGILIAATGVGAGDLATGAFSGSALGLSCLWAVLVGAGLKFVLTEGLARWQLVTGTSLLEGVIRRGGRLFAWLFLAYLLPWTWFVGAALASACGVTFHALFPVLDSPETAKVIWGAAHSLVGLALVWRGGFALFERIMAVCIGFMFVIVVVTAVLLEPDWAAVSRGLTMPTLPESASDLGWVVALMGGVGGTVTVLSYGYWIREKGREGAGELRTCRLDLAVGYLVTALFGVAMVIIGSTLTIEGRGAGLIVQLADRLQEPLGSPGRLVFLVGAWGAVFSSLLGVWQAVPLFFADAVGEMRGPCPPVRPEAPLARAYLVVLALVPLASLGNSFQALQKLYAVVGAAFMPLLAATLLIWNGRRPWVGDQHRNGIWTQLALIITLLFFSLAGYLALLKRFG